MKNRFSWLLIMIAWSSTIQAAPEDDALAAYDSFFTLFTAGNHGQIVNLFAPDALFYGTSSAELVTNPDGVRTYFTRALAGPAVVKATSLGKTALVLSDELVAVSGTWQSERTLDGKAVINGPLRNTVVLQKRGGRWMIVQFHNSPAPKP